MISTFLEETSSRIAAGRVAGGPPRVGGGVPAELDILGWTLPPWWARICAHHDGIGPRWAGGWGRPTLLPLDRVRPLTASIRFGEEDITFDPADALLITPDASLGGIVLQDRDDPVLRLFDGQRHALGRRISVEAYLTGLLVAWDDPRDPVPWPWL
jgi:hypothetical protein